MQEQTKQQKTLVLIISILNIVQYATQVNGKQLNEVMDALQKVNEDVKILFNITDILTQHLRCPQIYTYACTILAYLKDCLMYIRQVVTHTMYYVNAATTNILSPNILPVEELRNMLRLHLPISSDNTFHFYQDLTTQVLIADGQFLLLIDVPI